jgi:hypothetical protein
MKDFPRSPIPHTERQSMPQDPAAAMGDGCPMGWIDKIETFLWSHQAPDDPDWKATEVHLVLSVLSGPTDTRPPMKLVMRYKSEEAYAAQIEALVKSYKAVFGIRNF